jgi:protein dithiol oxidoreductase (disulfide-forming)
MTFAATPSFLRNRVAALVLAVGALLLCAAGGASAQLAEGRNYDRLKNPQPVETGDKIEVIEFFSYGCPHCAELEPHLATWLAKQPPDVAFRRVPVMFQERWVPLARIYYTLDSLGDEKRLSPDVFKAIHGQGMPLWTDKTFVDWAATKGLDRQKVEDVSKSFAINGKVSRARQQAQQYNIQSVPTIVIDGKFITGSERVGTHAQLPAAIEELVVKARAERKK